MSGVWKQARAQEKAMLDNLRKGQKRAERRAAYFASKVTDPLEQLFVIGLKAKTFKDDAQYNQMERNEPLVAWNGRPEITIDRYDVRALLDMIPDTKLPALPSTEEEAELEEQLNFERYHTLLRSAATKVSEADTIAAVRAKESRALASLRLAPTEIELAGAQVKEPEPRERERDKPPAEYSAVGFSYVDDESDDSDESSSEEARQDEKPTAKTTDAVSAPAVAGGARSGKDLTKDEREHMAKQAAAFGIRSFTRLYERMVEDDLADEERKSSAKRAAEKEARGERLTKRERRRIRDLERERTGFYDNARKSHKQALKDKKRRQRPSSTADSGAARPAESSATPERIEFITEFSAAAPQSPPSSPDEDERPAPPLKKPDPIQDMRMEPIIVSTPAERIHVIQSIDREFNHKQRQRQLQQQEPPPAQPERRTDVPAAPPVAKTEAKAATPAKETPAERLKRLMREKLNATQQKDSADAERKREEAERERVMRLDDPRVQRMRAKSPQRDPRPRSRSRSPERRRRRSRSRSRSPPRPRIRSRSRSPRRSRSPVARRRSPDRRSRSRSPPRSRYDDNRRR